MIPQIVAAILIPVFSVVFGVFWAAGIPLMSNKAVTKLHKTEENEMLNSNNSLRSEYKKITDSMGIKNDFFYSKKHSEITNATKKVLYNPREKMSYQLQKLNQKCDRMSNVADSKIREMKSDFKVLSLANKRLAERVLIKKLKRPFMFLKRPFMFNRR